jgi:hypothetical protein
LVLGKIVFTEANDGRTPSKAQCIPAVQQLFVTNCESVAEKGPFTHHRIVG